MSSIKKVKNNTAEAKDWVGTRILPGEYYTLEVGEWAKWAKEYGLIGSSFKEAVDLGEAVLSDGNTDLNIEESITYISTTQDADSIFFKDTLGLSLTKSTLQEAVKEVFSRNFKYINDLTLSSTNDTTFLNKISLSEVFIPGRYRLSWFYTWRLNSTKRFFKARVRLNDTTDVLEHVEEPTDSNAGIRNNANGFAYIDITEEGLNTFTFDFCSSNKDAQAYVYGISLEIWRVE